ncbi:hypothetical protein C8T65DRAFT_691872 [Cerioporus squamosus]|nr:hypothetical protein C8T65DRAFT_691872 [Cerioporus squamosus]
MSDREAKKLEKVLAKEAKADQKAIDHAMKDIKAAEKALQKCAKTAPQTSEKAQKKVSKQKKKEQSAAKALDKATQKHADKLEKEAKAQEKLSTKRQYETHTDQSSRQMHSNFDDCQHSAEANAKDREERLAQIHAQLLQRGASDPHNSAARL